MGSTYDHSLVTYISHRSEANLSELNWIYFFNKKKSKKLKSDISFEKYPKLSPSTTNFESLRLESLTAIKALES